MPIVGNEADFWIPEEWSDFPPLVRQTRGHVREWVDEERYRYADKGKFAEDSPGRDIIRDAVKDGDWERALTFVQQYIKRAEMLGLDTESGRQVMGKVVTSALHILETACEYHGPMPEPGYTSGEINPWTNPSYPLPEPRL